LLKEEQDRSNIVEINPVIREMIGNKNAHNAHNSKEVFEKEEGLITVYIYYLYLELNKGEKEDWLMMKKRLKKGGGVISTIVYLY
jgi:hypothetical protein